MIVRGSEILSKIGIGFIQYLSAKSSRFIFNNFITVKLKLIFKGWNRPVCSLLPECLSVSEAKRDGADA